MTLFDPPAERLSPKLTPQSRTATTFAQGWHPIAGRKLHADAAPHEDRKASGLRCGGCRFHVNLSHRSKTYPKCFWPNPEATRRKELPRVAHSSNTDCRGWYPACVDFEPAGGVSR